MRQEKFNPLDKKNLGVSVADALVTQRPEALGGVQSFDGAGIYALYYTGDFHPYRPMVRLNKDGRFEWPIYVGKAIPPGSSRGQFGLDPDPGQALHRRLSEHRASIEAATNVALDDFWVRYLLVDDIWIPLGEALLISRFCPPWNQVVSGFGIHHPGSGRFDQAPSDWDVLHPGRPWVARLTGRPQPRAGILQALAEALEETERRFRQHEE